MSGLALAAGALTLVAAVVHALVGGRELVTHLAPVDASAKAAEVRVQTIGGWHWVSMDLLLCGIGFVALGATHVPAAAMLLRILAGYFVLTGLTILGTVGVAGARRILRFPQWIFCFAVAALAWLAAG